MENNQTPTPNRPKRTPMAPRDMILIALAVLVMTRVDWAHMNSFHYLILFLLFLCFMLRWSNMRKEAVRKQDMERYKAQFEAEAEKQRAAHLTDGAAETSADQTPAEEIPAEDMTVDGEAVPVQEESEEKTEE